MSDEGERPLVCTQDPVEDAGEGVTFERRYIDGELDGIGWTHFCVDRVRDDYMIVQPAWPDGWVVEQLRPLTLSPSILCRICGRHGYIREGRWVKG